MSGLRPSDWVSSVSHLRAIKRLMDWCRRYDKLIHLFFQGNHFPAAQIFSRTSFFQPRFVEFTFFFFYPLRNPSWEHQQKISSIPKSRGECFFCLNNLSADGHLVVWCRVVWIFGIPKMNPGLLLGGTPKSQTTGPQTTNLPLVGHTTWTP